MINMSNALPDSARKVQAALARLGAPSRVVTMPATTRTVQDAAAAIGCAVGQIVKSIVFRGSVSGKPILVIASGANRINEESVSALSGEPITKASADFVRESTGFAIGGVPPVGFSQPIETWIDESLMRYAKVWAAAGTPNAVFSLDPQALPAMTGGKAVDIR
jgi:prolyl-tRNA editing enzyme YbaK/EbsC (Cys-tRNA(Pro) deacylase)